MSTYLIRGATLIVGLVIFAISFSGAVPAHAQTSAATDIASLTAMLESLKAQVNALMRARDEAMRISGASAPEAAPMKCVQIIRNLRKGARDGVADTSVKTLQQWLKSTNDFNEESTGYFGALTEQAVRRFQCRELGLCDGAADANGYGAVGPRTREKMLALCAKMNASNTGTTSSGTGSSSQTGVVATSTVNTQTPSETTILDTSTTSGGNTSTNSSNTTSNSTTATPFNFDEEDTDVFSDVDSGDDAGDAESVE